KAPELVCSYVAQRERSPPPGTTCPPSRVWIECLDRSTFRVPELIRPGHRPLRAAPRLARGARDPERPKEGRQPPSEPSSASAVSPGALRRPASLRSNPHPATDAWRAI